MTLSRELGEVIPSSVVCSLHVNQRPGMGLGAS
jgi:hypothetical protein